MNLNETTENQKPLPTRWRDSGIKAQVAVYNDYAVKHELPTIRKMDAEKVEKILIDSDGAIDRSPYFNYMNPYFFLVPVHNYLRSLSERQIEEEFLFPNHEKLLRLFELRENKRSKNTEEDPFNFI